MHRSVLAACVAALALIATLMSLGAQSRQTLTEEWHVTTAVCDQAAAYSPLLHSKGTLFPPYACNNGSNVVTAEVEFLDTETDTVWWDRKLPADWRPTVDLKLYWRTAAITGNVVYQVRTICVGDAQTIDPAMNTAQTITDAAKATTLQMNVATLSNITMTGCDADDTLHVSIFRNPAHASDTIAASAFLRSFTLTVRRSVALE